MGVTPMGMSSMDQLAIPTPPLQFAGKNTILSIIYDHFK
jgi:hypothetical protein